MIEIKEFAPVIIPTLCRYEHFKNCMESLAKCTWADHTEVYVAIDFPAKEQHWEGYDKINAYLDNCRLPFKKVHVIKRERNYGISNRINNYTELKREVRQKHDFWIFTEDDNIFAPSFLDFMNKAFVRYWDDEKIVNICGYTPEEWAIYDKCITLSKAGGANRLIVGL